jgi:hypothetical protein
MRIPRMKARDLVLATVFAMLLVAVLASRLASIRRPAPSLDGLDALLANREFMVVEKQLE